MHAGGRSDDVEKVQVAQMVRISIQHRATPTPKPTPRPTPKPIVHIVPKVLITPRHIVVPVSTPAPAAPKRAAHATGRARNIAHTKHHLKTISFVPTTTKITGGAGALKTGAGRGANGTGTGTGAGGAGNGTGAGGNGNGTGGKASGDEPCGFVEFTNINTPHYDKGTGGFYQDIRLTVHYGDRTTQSYNLDYPFYYPSEAAFPWSSQNKSNPDFPVLFQNPPADKLPNEPPIVVYVMHHSVNGLTTLKDCSYM